MHKSYTMKLMQMKWCAKFETELTRVLNKVAPLKSKIIHQRPKQLWYTQQLREQKLIVRNRERKWLKYQTNETWKAYKRERNRYNNMLTYEKQQNVIGLVQKAIGDTQKLYKIVNKIIGKRDQNPFPEGKSDDQLAKDFADYLYTKIVNIRKAFIQVKPIEIDVTDHPIL